MPAPNRRNKGETLAQHISNNTAARGIANDRDNLVATRTRHAKKWEDAAARLNGSDLERRAEQVRTDAQRADQFRRFEADVRAGRAKPPIVALARDVKPHYLLGQCLDCSRELWVHSPQPRVPLCLRCWDKRAHRAVENRRSGGGAKRRLAHR